MDLKTGDAQVSPVLFWEPEKSGVSEVLGWQQLSLDRGRLRRCGLLADRLFLCCDLAPTEATSLMTRRRWPAMIFGFIPEFHSFRSCAVTA
jgi:hypothetical protein